MDERAFNMFTALVAFILIALSALLVQQMTASERTAYEVIRSIECKSEIKAISDMKRADTFQTFNYLLRYRIADFFGSSPTELNMRGKDWDTLVHDFQTEKFGSNARNFANFTVTWLIALYSDMPAYYGKCGTYQIKTVDWGNRKEEMIDGLEDVFKQNIENDDFIEVIECENGDPYNCPSGAFYITLDLTQIEEETYDKLPAIEITNLNNGNMIKEIILPRRKFKIYVPVRIFKALAEVHSFAKFPGNDYGFFSPRLHNELEMMKLGYCDAGYCNPRTNPYTPPATDVGAKSCSRSDSPDRIDNVELCGAGDSFTSRLDSDYGVCTPAPEQYNPRNLTTMQDKLKDIVKRRLCFIANNTPGTGNPFIGAGTSEGLVPANISPGVLDCNIDQIIVETKAEKSKKIKIVPSGSAPSTAPAPLTSSFRANQNLSSSDQCPMDWIAGLTGADTRFIGYSFDGSNVVCAGAENCSGIPADSCSNSTLNSDERWEYCAGIDSIRLVFTFKETDEEYMVDNSHDYFYRIEIRDESFTPFTAQYSQTNTSPAKKADYCGLEEFDPARHLIPCSFNDKDWHCISYDSSAAGGLMGGPTGTGACVPAPA